jgi:outer membrane biosynthesis protein TonB
MGNAPKVTGLIWSCSFLAALVAHAALGLPWLWRDPEALAGAGGQQLDVISVTMVSPGVLESREIDQAKPIAPAAAAPVESNEGTAAPDQREIKKEEPEKPETKPEEDTRTADAILEVKPETPKESEERQENAEGGTAARGEAVTQQKARAPVAASAGAAREYARSVAQALRKTKPKGIGAQLGSHSPRRAGYACLRSQNPAAIVPWTKKR